MATRQQKAKQAYRHKSAAESRKAHTKKAIHHKEKHAEGGTHVGDFVYGAIDGSVTTFAVVSGVAGAALSANIVIILGLANLLADGLSMAVGNYLSSKSEREYARNERKREEWEVENVPDGEREEIRQIYRRKGFRGPLLEKVVAKITGNREVWVDTMMKEELGLIEDQGSPVKKGWITFISFVLVGSIPLLSYFGGIFSEVLRENAYQISIVLTAFAFFFVGSAKVYVTGKNWFKSGLETLLVGGLAAVVAYGVGFALRGLA